MDATVTPVRRVVGWLAVAVVLFAGCKVDARVDVTLRANGSGRVAARLTLDRDAVQRLTRHAPLDRAVPLDDVEAAGWKISGWKPEAGGQTITLSHDFVGQADLARRLEDLVGPTGVLRDARLTRARGWFTAKDAIAITGDLGHLSTGLRADHALAKNLAAAGVDVNALDAQLRSELGQALTLTLTVHAPNGQTKTVELRSGGEATVSSASVHTNFARIVLVGLGVALLVLALVLTAASLAATRRRRRRSSASARP